MSTLAYVTLHLGSLLLIGASAWAFGETVLTRCAVREDGAGRPALATALGLGLIAQGLFVLGLAGLLDRWVILGALAAAHFPCRRTWRTALEARHRLRSSLRSGAPRLLAALAVASPLAALAFYPPTGFDATVYHLPYVQAFLEAKRLVFVPELRFPVFPQVVEMGFLLGFVLSGEAAAKLTQVLSMFLTAALLFSWGRRICSPRAGAWAAALWLGTPLTVWIASLAYVDVGLALFVTAAVYSWERWRDDGPEAWLGLAGLFVGLAAGTKYLGLFFCGALVVATAIRAVQGRPWRSVFVLTGAAALTAGPWYLRILCYTGNPVFPFFEPLFGASDWTHPSSGGGLGDGLLGLVLLPWNAVFHREVFDFQAPLSPFFLLLVPLCIPPVLRCPRIRRLLVLVALYGLFWLVTTRDLRFFLAVLPLLVLALAAGLDRWIGARASGSLAAGIAALLLLPGLFYAGYKLHERGPVPVTPEARRAFLAAQVPGYEGIHWLNETAGSDYTVYALFGERLRYFAAGRYLGDWFGTAPYPRIVDALGDGRTLHGELRLLGADYFLVRRTGTGFRPPEDEFFAGHFELVWEGSGFTLYRIHRERSAGRPEPERPP